MMTNTDVQTASGEQFTHQLSLSHQQSTPCPVSSAAIGNQQCLGECTHELFPISNDCSTCKMHINTTHLPTQAAHTMRRNVMRCQTQPEYAYDGLASIVEVETVNKSLLLQPSGACARNGFWVCVADANTMNTRKEIHPVNCDYHWNHRYRY